MFHIQTTRVHWIGDLPDDGMDLCLHGETTVRMEDRTLSYDASVTSTALYLLKNLTEDVFERDMFEVFWTEWHRRRTTIF